MALSSVMTQSLLSANTSRQIAHVQHAAKKQMDGHAGVLDAEIKMDGARGGDTEKKQEELEETKKKASALTETTINTLTTANGDLKKAAKEDQEAQKAEEAAEKKKAEKAAEKKKAEKKAAEKKAEEERIEKAKRTTAENREVSDTISTAENREVPDTTPTVGAERTMPDHAAVDIVSSGISMSTGSVSEAAGKNVDVKV